MIENGSANWLGLVLLFVGLGYIVLWWFEDRHLAQRDRTWWVGLDPKGMQPTPATSMSSPPVSDAALIARVVVGDDRHAFGELVRRHQSAVRATLRKLTSGNAALADDLAQETFLLAYRNLKSFRQEARFSTWLYRIAYNAFLADARKMKELPLPEEVDVDAAPAEGPSHRRCGEKRDTGDRSGARDERSVGRRTSGDRAVLP